MARSALQIVLGSDVDVNTICMLEITNIYYNIYIYICIYIYIVHKTPTVHTQTSKNDAARDVCGRHQIIRIVLTYTRARFFFQSILN